MISAGTTILISIITLAAGVIVAKINGRNNTRQAEIESTRSPYEALAARVVKLEEDAINKDNEIAAMSNEIQELRSEQHDNRTFILKLLSAWPKDKIPPQPYPSWYAPENIDRFYSDPE